jgi:hypothetical protein
MNKIRIRDPGWEKFGSGIWDKHSGFATLYTALIMLIGKKLFFYLMTLSNGPLASEAHGAGDPARDLWWEGGQPSLAQRVPARPGHYAPPRQTTYSL